LSTAEDKKLKDETPEENAEENLLGEIDLSGEGASEDASEPKEETPDEAPPVSEDLLEIPAEQKALPSDEAAESLESEATEDSDVSEPALEEKPGESNVVELPELKKLNEQDAIGLHVSTLNTLPPGWKLVKTVGLVQTAVLLQSKRIQELRIQEGMKSVIHQLKEEAVSENGNAILGIQVSITPLGQLYPDSVWVSATGTCCVIERRKKRPKKEETEEAEPIPR